MLELESGGVRPMTTNANPSLIDHDITTCSRIGSQENGTLIHFSVFNVTKQEEIPENKYTYIEVHLAGD